MRGEYFYGNTAVMVPTIPTVHYFKTYSYSLITFTLSNHFIIKAVLFELFTDRVSDRVLDRYGTRSR